MVEEELEKDTVQKKDCLWGLCQGILWLALPLLDGVIMQPEGGCVLILRLRRVVEYVGKKFEAGFQA